MSDQQKQAKEIFWRALDQQGDVEAFLRDACGDDAQLQNRVQQLLKAHRDAGDFLIDKPLDETADSGRPASNEITRSVDVPDAKQAEQIGPYKLLEQIGQGGMGSVWVAKQSEPIKRKVAIKLIKAGMDSGQVLARFEAERQALAMMDHPNIARVLDGGVTEQGRPYFAMEYVKGVPLTEYCDQAKLSVRERLELFLPICYAVQHAHQKGIIHRDLKPSNILICLYDGKPVPKVIDFGLAKAMHHSLTEQSIYTAHGMMVGTPLYMSPEQAEYNNLDIDTRTDIYALGVILYELLTGGTPLERARMKEAAYNEVLRLIKEFEPPKPSTRLSGSESLPSVAAQRGIEPTLLARSIAGDLDWVVMKALEKERTRRYETANGLAEDIRRHLSDEPVSAGSPSRIYRLRKFARRNSSALKLVSGIAGTLAIVGCIAAWTIHAASQRNLDLRLETAVSSLQTKRGIILPPLENLDTFPRHKVEQALLERYDEASDSDRLTSAFALAHYGDVRIEYLLSQVAHAPADEASNFISALNHSPGESLSAIRAAIENANQIDDWKTKCRLAILATYLGDTNSLQDVCQTREDLAQRTQLINELSGWHGQLSVLHGYISDSDSGDAVMAVICGVGSIPPEELSKGEQESWETILLEFYGKHPDAGVHSAAKWALNRLGIGQQDRLLKAAPANSEWAVNDLGITLIKVQPGDFVRESRKAADLSKVTSISAQKITDGVGPSISQTVEISKPFWLADREVSQRQFSFFINDRGYPASEKPISWMGADPRSPTEDHPVQRVNWFDAVLFCNWLSSREGLEPCYKAVGDYENGGQNWRKWSFEHTASGYRLPTEAEWEYACRAGTTTAYNHGDDFEYLPLYAAIRMSTFQTTASKLPNSWGFFDLHGNVWEWCSDRHGMYGTEPHVTDPQGAIEGKMRILRGGDCLTLDEGALQSKFRFTFPDYYRRHNHGFRVARN